MSPVHVDPADHDEQWVPDAAVTTGARAVAAFADRHRLDIPDELREELARQVLTAARPNLDTAT
ncbi:hypothetical protein WEI85_05895 [Actinomycetes bacterium KLBMP 9797]